MNLHAIDRPEPNLFGGSLVQVSRCLACGDERLALRSAISFGDTVILMAMVGGMCLSWPQLGRALMLASRLVMYYCLSPR